MCFLKNNLLFSIVLIIIFQHRKAAFPLTRLNGRAAKRARSAARQNPFHWRVETRRNAQERAGDVGELFWTVLRRCGPIHAVEFSRNAANRSFYNKPTINLGLTCRNRSF